MKKYLVGAIAKGGIIEIPDLYRKTIPEVKALDRFQNTSWYDLNALSKAGYQVEFFSQNVVILLKE